MYSQLRNEIESKGDIPIIYIFSTLEKYNKDIFGYSEIKVLFQETHDYSVNGDFQYTGTYTPETVHPSGNYRLKLEVIAPNGVNELARYQDFNYCRSGFHIDLGSVNQNGIAKQWLIPGESYTIQFNCPAAALNISKPGISFQAGNSNTSKFVAFPLVHFN